MIPMNDVVKVYMGGKTDDWGIAVTNTEPVILKGIVQYSPSRRKSAEGETVDLELTVTFKGVVDIPIGSEIVLEGSEKRYIVLGVYPVKDLAGKTIFTKVVV